MRFVKHRLFLVVLALLVVAAFGFVSGDSRRGADPHVAEYAHLSKTHAEALLVVRYVQKATMDGEEVESDCETVGIMIDPSGLVVCSSNGMIGPEGDGVTVSATNFKVLIGEDTEGLEASLLARDQELDLTWLRIRKPKGRVFKAIDPAAGAVVQPGERLLTLSRLGKYFDRVPQVLEGRISAIVSKPRDLIAPGGLTGGIGDPVFLPDGTFVGLFVLQTPEVDESNEENSDEDLVNNIMILPAATLEKATDRAKRTAASAPASQPAEDQRGADDGE